jgi:hypothetical protein
MYKNAEEIYYQHNSRRIHYTVYDDDNQNPLINH